jgi:hypothetical protein
LNFSRRPGRGARGTAVHGGAHLRQVEPRVGLLLGHARVDAGLGAGGRLHLAAGVDSINQSRP